MAKSAKLIKKQLKKRDKRRIITLAVCSGLCFALLLCRAFELQVHDADRYVAQASGITTITAPIKAARGEILDYYGRPIATNREGYNIIFNYASINKGTLNDTILSLIKLLGDSSKWKDDLPLDSKSPYNFTKDEGSDSTAVSKLLNTLNLAHYATAQNCFDALVKRYELEDRETEIQRLIMGVRYTMERADFSVSAPFTFAEDVSKEIMAVISEESSYAQNGVSIEVATFREYDDSSIAPHIIGMVGPIYAEEWEKYQKKGYSYSDKVGKSGIEASCEDYLHGTDGEITYRINSKGTILSSTVTKQTVPGNTVRLTLDKSIQLSAQSALAQTIKQMNNDKVYVTDGAAVAMNIKTGGVLASVNYPTYTYKQYKENYKELAADKNKPLFDRAFNGTYPPGSTFKPAVACAALQLGVISPNEVITCRGKYRYYDDYQPSCMHVHGGITLNTALSKSCNYYFFEAGRRVGIKKLNQYCTEFGLGQKTGVEITESAGTLAGPESRSEWYEGYTISAAIGQLDNAFTPLQLASYTSTIANSGTRYKATLIDKVVSYTQDKTIMKNEPKVLNKVDVSQNVIDTVKKGMLSVTEDGTGSRIFKDYPITVGGKTGTAEVAKGEDHTVFVAFAPYDDPEIAVAVVIEHGKYGKYSGSMLKSIFNAYFFNELEKYYDIPSYELLY